jgi:lysophospholipase L1-like esterase
VSEWVKRGIGVLVGIGAALVLAELVLWLVPLHLPIAIDIFARDADGGLRLQPHAVRQHASPEWNVRVEINGQGFRDVDPPPRAAQPVILGLGDSLTFGWGVEYEESFLRRLEVALGGADQVRVLKAGIPGTGPTDQLQLLRQLLETVRPRVVVVGFYVGNDFQDAAEGGARQFDIVDGFLVRRGDTGAGSPVAWLQRWLKRNSRLAQLVALQLWLREQRQAAAVPVDRQPHAGVESRDGWLRRFIRVHLAGAFPPDLQRGVETALSALGAMHGLAREHGARFLLVVIPPNIQVHEGDRRRYQDAFGLPEAGWDLDRPQRILQEWAAREQVELLDPLPALREAGRSGRLYFFPDSHLNARGHAVLAGELVRYLREHPIVPSTSFGSSGARS